jgi:hypothetical protein
MNQKANSVNPDQTDLSATKDLHCLPLDKNHGVNNKNGNFGKNCSYEITNDNNYVNTKYHSNHS